MARDLSIKDFYKLPGVNDIQPLKARGEFARALAIEHNAGRTTQAALDALDKAIGYLPPQ
jgi:hypothetical protein